MSKKLTCFVIAPIGETGSQIRQDSDDLLDLIIKPALEVFGIDVIRGDHRNESGQIDIDVIKLVQESDLCIVDLSIENVNVYYEMGRRDECGKPILLLKSSMSSNLPADIATRRYIEFNLDDRRAIISARDKIKEAVQVFKDEGMEKSKGTSLYSISEKIDRIDRNLARLVEKEHFAIRGGNAPEEWDNENPQTLFRVALLKKNIPMAEFAMEKLYYSMEESSFYDLIVERVALLGSRKAGQMLIDNAQHFMDSTSDTQKKVEYLGCLVSYLNKTDQESSYLAIIEPIALGINNEDGDIPHAVYNQLNRLYYGAYITTNDTYLLDQSLAYVEKAIKLEPTEGSYYYNLTLCYESKADNAKDEDEELQMIQVACDNIYKAVKLDGDEYDEDHLVLACRLFHRAQDATWLEYLDVLSRVSPNRAILLKQSLK